CIREPTWFSATARLNEPGKSMVAAAAGGAANPKVFQTRQTTRVLAQLPTGGPPRRSVVSEISQGLRESLLKWRRETAEKQGVSAFIVMPNASLDELCRVRPCSLDDLRTIYGFGERKTLVYGPEILDVLERFRRVAITARAKPPAKKSLRRRRRCLD
ncbi:MAG: HRDC domain-containing protein, partial [Candidatus Acidiferrum sp.]